MGAHPKYNGGLQRAPIGWEKRKRKEKKNPTTTPTDSHPLFSIYNQQSTKSRAEKWHIQEADKTNGEECK